MAATIFSLRCRLPMTTPDPIRDNEDYWFPASRPPRPSGRLAIINADPVDCFRHSPALKQSAAMLYSTAFDYGLEAALNALYHGFACAGLGLFLCSCATAPQQVYWKTGESFEHRQSDVTNCEVKALQAVPRAIAFETSPSYTTPVYTTPVKTNCHPRGENTSCTTTGGDFYGGRTYGGQTYSYDVNEALRKRVVMQCLSLQGYQRITVPVCSKKEAENTISLIDGRLPFIGGVQCLTKDQSAYVPKF